MFGFVVDAVVGSDDSCAVACANFGTVAAAERAADRRAVRASHHGAYRHAVAGPNCRTIVCANFGTITCVR